MNRNQNVLIRYTAEEKQRLEQAAALAGYDALAPYIRDRSLAQNNSENNMTTVDALTPLLFGLQRLQGHQTGLLTVLLALTLRKTTSGDLHAVEVDLMRAQELGMTQEKLAALLTPQINKLLSGLVESM